VDRGFHAEFIGVKLKRPSPDSTISAESLTDSFVETVKSRLQVNPKNIRTFHFGFQKGLFFKSVVLCLIFSLLADFGV
tara:strand:- start:72 stop:305 length:234 start_codon:yes stop_codon:yes gene_type:complete